MNRPRLLRDGAEAFPAMLAAIRGAKQFILMETYIFASDAIGEKFAKALAEKASQGVEVDLMYDGLGTGRLSQKIVQILSAGGVRVVKYHPVRLSPRIWEWRLWGKRNHRKQLIREGRGGFLGGHKPPCRKSPPGPRSGRWRKRPPHPEGRATRSAHPAFSCSL